MWVVIALEINFWLTQAFKSKLFLGGVSILFILGGMLLFHNLLVANRINKYVNSFYTESKSLSNCFYGVRAQLNSDSKLAVIGSTGNVLSPSLLDWQFGKPIGFNNYIGIVPADQYDKIKAATHLLIIAPEKDNTDIETINSYQQQLQKINELITNNRIQFINENSIKELKITFRLYKFI
jgi:hypothetical protein